MNTHRLSQEDLLSDRRGRFVRGRRGGLPHVSRDVMGEVCGRQTSDSPGEGPIREHIRRERRCIGVTILGLLLESPPDHSLKVRAEFLDIGIGREMLHQDLPHRLPLERHSAGEQFVEDDSQGVKIDSPVIVAGAYLGRHVVDGPDADGLSAVARNADILGQPVVADLYVSVLVEDILRLQITVDDCVDDLS